VLNKMTKQFEWLQAPATNTPPRFLSATLSDFEGSSTNFQPSPKTGCCHRSYFAPWIRGFVEGKIGGHRAMIREAEALLRRSKPRYG